MSQSAVCDKRSQSEGLPNVTTCCVFQVLLKGELARSWSFKAALALLFLWASPAMSQADGSTLTMAGLVHAQANLVEPNEMCLSLL
jgi:hypothetical protein